MFSIVERIKVFYKRRDKLKKLVSNKFSLKFKNNETIKGEKSPIATIKNNSGRGREHKNSRFLWI